MRLMLTTNPGIEDIAAEEAEARLGARVLEIREGRGRVVVDAEEESLELVHLLRSIHRARIVVAEARVCGEERCLEEIARVVEESGVHRFIPRLGSFAVRANRVGSHAFRSLDIARVAGDAIIRAAVAETGVKPRVDLDYPSTVIHVDLVEDELTVSVEIGGEMSWHRRGYRVYDHPAALKPTLAYAMIRLSGAVDGDTILDPMCGGGTVPIEAAYLFEDSRMICLDKNPRHIWGARLNARAALVEGRIRFIVGDARMLSRYVEEVDVLVTNPPYGIRLGSPRQVRRVYKSFLEEATRVVRKAIVLITPEHEYAKRVLLDAGWRISHERTVAHGNLYPRIIVATP